MRRTHMKARIQRWGNSLALRIPKPLAEMSELKEDSEVDLSVSKRRLVVVASKRTAAGRRRYNLTTMIRQLTPENSHKDIEFGPAVGKEIW
jgi:antitoxin MazE